MEMLEVILICVYTTVILLGTTLLYARFMLLRGYTLNSTQRNIQNLSFISLLLSIIWAAIYLPWDYLLTFSFAPMGIVLIASRFLHKYDASLIRYKFILDTALVFLSIVLWILS